MAVNTTDPQSTSAATAPAAPTNSLTPPVTAGTTKPVTPRGGAVKSTNTSATTVTLSDEAISTEASSGNGHCFNNLFGLLNRSCSSTPASSSSIAPGTEPAGAAPTPADTSPKFQPLDDSQVLREGAGMGRQSASGDRVKRLQQALKQQGYQIDDNGHYGGATRRAVLAFQKKAGIGQDGVAGHETIGALNRVMSKGTRGVSDPADPKGTGPQKTDPAAGTTAPGDNLNEEERKTAAFLNKYMLAHGSSRLPQDIGDRMVRAGRQNDVDPRVLAAIAFAETGGGRNGVGVNGLLGYGAINTDPMMAVRNNQFAGVDRQLSGGAKLFADLRRAHGASAQSPMAAQVHAVEANGRGWAQGPGSATRWPRMVMSAYNRLLAAERQG